MKIELQTTLDGSSTLYVPEMDEHYHSTNGAVTEGQHVYIKEGLFSLDLNRLSVLEVGFGTGLNAALTLIEARKKSIFIDYTSVELYPLDMSVVENLDFGFDDNDRLLFHYMHEGEWNVPVYITDAFVLTKLNVDLQKFSSGKKFDIVYFDAFAPDKQPEMWTEEIFGMVYGLMNSGGIMTTYCAKGAVRRMMKNVGFSVERLAGPPGKREMLRAIKL